MIGAERLIMVGLEIVKKLGCDVLVRRNGNDTPIIDKIAQK